MILRAAITLGLAFKAGIAAACTLAQPTGMEFPTSFVTSENAVSSVAAAYFVDGTEAYAHGVLGDAIEPTGILVAVARSDGACAQGTIPVGEGHVFEDIAPRLADVDGDGSDDIIVVRTSMTMGAQLAVYGLRDGVLGMIASTPYIGRSNRWLAPAAIADLDGDGRIEIAYVDRPHLAKVLRVWRYDRGALVHVADAPGLTNHRIGEDFISGGLRDCGQGPEVITADADWREIRATVLRGGQLRSRRIGPFEGRGSMQDALTCR